GGERGFGLRGDRGERRRLRHGEIREHLAVERVARQLETADPLRVVETVLARGRVDAHDPEPAELALLVLAADIRVLRGGVDRLFRGAIELALGLIKPFRTCEQLLSLRTPNRSTFDSRHCFLSVCGRTRQGDFVLAQSLGWLVVGRWLLVVRLTTNDQRL